MRYLILIIIACTPCFSEDFPWGWINLEPAGDLKKVQAIVEPLIKAASLPAGCKVGINLDAAQDLKHLHLNVNRPSTGAFPNTFKDEDNKKSFDALIWVDYQISDMDKNYAYLAAYVKSALSLPLAK
jgi:hypothetical protein